jgi:hypothetical protein
MALRTKARFVEVVLEAPLAPVMMVLKALLSRVILMGLRVIVSKVLLGDYRDIY